MEKIELDMGFIGPLIKQAVKAALVEAIKETKGSIKGELDNVDWGNILSTLIQSIIPKIPVWIDEIFGFSKGEDNNLKKFLQNQAIDNIEAMQQALELALLNVVQQIKLNVSLDLNDINKE